MNTPTNDETSVRTEEPVTHMLTFGSQYATEPHPTVGIVSPDGWVTITGATHEQVREIAIKHFGIHFSTTYPSSRFGPSMHFYPLGELVHINADTPPLTKEVMVAAIEEARTRRRRINHIPRINTGTGAPA